MEQPCHTRHNSIDDDNGISIGIGIGIGIYYMHWPGPPVGIDTGTGDSLTVACDNVRDRSIELQRLDLQVCGCGRVGGFTRLKYTDSWVRCGEAIQYSHVNSKRVKGPEMTFFLATSRF